METLQILGTALGLATLAGINLYLTVFLTGLAIRYDWITLASQYQQLEILAHPAVITVAGVMFLVEFLADKVPWLDSAWDTVHTIIRPVGGTLLAIQVLGESHPVYDVIVAMLACGLSLATHTLKAGTRVVVNGSPEPMTNVAVSLVEDVGVVGGLWLLWFDPVIAVVVFVLFLAVAWWFAPRLFRAARARLWLVWRKLKAPAAGGVSDGALPDHLPPDADILVHRATGGEGTVVWAVHCLVGRWKGIAHYKNAWLVDCRSHPGSVFLAVPGRFGRGQIRELALDGFKWSRESKFLTENISIHHPETGEKYLLLLDRGRPAIADGIIRALNAKRDLLAEEGSESGAPAEDELAESAV